MITVQLKLYANLSDWLPNNSNKNVTPVKVADNTSPYDIMDALHIPREMAHLVMVNGVYVPESERLKNNLLKEGDTLAIWPPVAGG